MKKEKGYYIFTQFIVLLLGTPCLDKRKSKLRTCISPNGRTKNKIDYSLVSTDLKGLVKNSKVFNSADTNSENCLLMEKYVIFLSKVMHYKCKPKRCDVSKRQVQLVPDTFKVQLDWKIELLKMITQT